jgi:hypothetical protein
VTSDEMVKLQLPAKLCQSALERFGSRFDSIDALLTFILQEVLFSDAVKMDEAEQRMLEGRLKDLGYI